MKKSLLNSSLKLIAFLCGILFCVLSFSQNVNISGTVKNSSAVAISDVKLTLKNQPAFSATTNASGNFNLSGTITGIAVLAENEFISFGANGLVNLLIKNEPVRIDIFSISGRIVSSILNNNRMNGIFQVNASAYVPQDQSIYIVRVMVGDKVKSNKFISSNSRASKGLIEISQNTPSFLKSGTAVTDTLILTHKDYKTKKMFLSSYIASLGTITMEVETTVPAAPVTLAATAVSASQIDLSWTDNSNNETGFRIERAPGGTSSFTEIATVGAGITAFQNTGLTASTSYIYRVRAYNNIGNSAYTNNSNATTQAQPATVPAAPTVLATTVISSTQINLSWTDNSNNETGFRIERAPGGTSSFTEIATVGAGITAFQNTGLTASTSYIYRVRAYNNIGNSAYTNNSNATTQAQPATVPAAPTVLTATVISSTQINLSWTDNSNNETIFSIERAPGGTTSFTEIATVGASITTYQNTGLTASTTYVYRVRAKNSVGYSGYSNSVSAKTNDLGQATVRVQNNTKYDMTTIKLNGVEKLSSGYILPVGNSEDYIFATAGTVTYNITVGYIDANLKRTDFFTFTGSVQAVVGQVVNINCDNPSLATILSNFSASKNWSGYYFDANNNYHECGYTFYNDGSFRLYDGTALIGTGTATLVKWPDRSSIITFKLGTTESIEMIYPFASFMQSNGPASWKVITYTKQL